MLESCFIIKLFPKIFNSWYLTPSLYPLPPPTYPKVVKGLRFCCDFEKRKMGFTFKISPSHTYFYLKSLSATGWFENMRRFYVNKALEHGSLPPTILYGQGLLRGFQGHIFGDQGSDRTPIGNLGGPRGKFLAPGRTPLPGILPSPVQFSIYISEKQVQIT